LQYPFTNFAIRHEQIDERHAALGQPDAFKLDRGGSSMQGTMAKLLYFVTEDWFFCRHFLPMARAARELGFEVVVATRVRKHAERIAEHGCRVIALENERRSVAPGEIIRTLVRMVRIVRTERPDVVQCIAVRMAVIGGLATRLSSRGALILALTGLGHLWIENGLFERLARLIVRPILGTWLRGDRTRFLFENADDPRTLRLDPKGAEVTIVGGAGVDPQHYPVGPEPAVPPVKVAVVARMIKSKGIANAVAATQRARAAGALIELHLYGAPDPSNYRSISEDQLRKWSAEPGIHWHGQQADIATIWREHHIAMLLSYGEGLPRSLVEAAAAGRPILTTRVPGCTEVVRDGVEGIVVEPNDIESAAQALLRLAADPQLRGRMGQAAHQRFRERFTEDHVRGTMTKLYRSLLPQDHPKG
jgi:glycosyltransferase involved in cell wall biosynthesis